VVEFDGVRGVGMRRPTRVITRKKKSLQYWQAPFSNYM